MVPEGRRNATSDVRTLSEAARRKISFVCGTRGDRALRVQGHCIRRSRVDLDGRASTISRELRRNAATRSGGLEYRATTAQWHAERSARRPKPASLR